MAKLTEDIKRHIITELACFRTPSEIVESVRQEFGIEIKRQQAHDYNPDGNKGDHVAKKWKLLHEATRKKFLEDTSAVPVAHKAFRLNKLNGMVQKAENMRNFQLAGQLLEQAAKECGGVYTNKHKLEHSGEVRGGVMAVPVAMEPKAWAEAAKEHQSRITSE